MKRIEKIAKSVDCIERVKILGGATLSIARIADKLLKRANTENVPDEKVLDLIRYLRSFESFQELESYWFYLYNPKDPEEWEAVLDHVYRRSITPKHLLN